LLQTKEMGTTLLRGDSPALFPAYIHSRFNTAWTETGTPAWRSSRMDLGWWLVSLMETSGGHAPLCRRTCGWRRANKSGHEPPGRAICMTMLNGRTPLAACLYSNRCVIVSRGGKQYDTTTKCIHEYWGLNSYLLTINI